jgi:hypothetical protein
MCLVAGFVNAMLSASVCWYVCVCVCMCLCTCVVCVCVWSSTFYEELTWSDNQGPTVLCTHTVHVLNVFTKVVSPKDRKQSLATRGFVSCQKKLYKFAPFDVITHLSHLWN